MVVDRDVHPRAPDRTEPADLKTGPALSLRALGRSSPCRRTLDWARIAEAGREVWPGEVEGLKVSLAGAEQKLPSWRIAKTLHLLAMVDPLTAGQRHEWLLFWGIRWATVQRTTVA